MVNVAAATIRTTLGLNDTGLVDWATRDLTCRDRTFDAASPLGVTARRARNREGLVPLTLPPGLSRVSATFGCATIAYAGRPRA